jgi:DNA-binding PadR family transcriptional regulator
MEHERLIESEWRQGETGRRRRYYRLRREGRAALREEKRQWQIVHETLNQLWRQPARST